MKRQEIDFHHKMNFIQHMTDVSMSPMSLSREGPLPSLTALRAFEAAARHESFRLAAEELSITQSAVSHQIAHLEAHLGKDLFRRTGRRVELTEAGRLYFPYLREAFELIETGTRLVSRPAQQELTVQVYVTVAARWLMPRVHTLQKSCPDLHVRFNTSQMDWEFDPRNADIGMVCTVDSQRPGFTYTPLFESRLVAVCSPNLLKNQPPLANPRDVARFTLLELYTAAGDWDAWLGPGGRLGLSEAASIRFDSYLLALEAACDGQGIALAPDFLAEPDLASGRLVSPIRHSVPQPARWYLVARQDRADELAIQRFRDWLIKEVEPLRRV